MLPREIQDALDSLLGDLNSEELDRKRKKYAPPEPEAKPTRGVSITIVTGKHPEPDGDEPQDKAAEPFEDPDELTKLLGGDDEEPSEDDEPEEKAKPKVKRLRRY